MEAIEVTLFRENCCCFSNCCSDGEIVGKARGATLFEDNRLLSRTGVDLCPLSNLGTAWEYIGWLPEPSSSLLEWICRSETSLVSGSREFGVDGIVGVCGEDTW